jgi:hypothetical protein
MPISSYCSAFSSSTALTLSFTALVVYSGGQGAVFECECLCVSTGKLPGTSAQGLDKDLKSMVAALSRKMKASKKHS